MPEPVTTGVGAGAATLAGVAVVSHLSGVNIDVAMGAFAGSIFFVVMNQNYKIFARILLAVVSFLAGIIGHKPIVGFMVQYIPESYLASADALGALVFSATAVGVLILISKKLNNGDIGKGGENTSGGNKDD